MVTARCFSSSDVERGVVFRMTLANERVVYNRADAIMLRHIVACTDAHVQSSDTICIVRLQFRVARDDTRIENY